MAKVSKTAKKANANQTITLLENGKVYGSLVNANEVSLHRINELAKSTIDGFEYQLQIGDYKTDLKKFATRAKRYVKFLSNVVVPEELDPIDLTDMNDKIRKNTEKVLMRAYTFKPNQIKDLASMSQTKFMDSLKSQKHIGTALAQVAELIDVEPKNLLTNGK